MVSKSCGNKIGIEEGKLEIRKEFFCQKGHD